MPANPKKNYAVTARQLVPIIKRWAKRESCDSRDMVVMTGVQWSRKVGPTKADVIICCKTKLLRALKSNAEVMEEFSELLGEHGYRYDLRGDEIRVHGLGINPGPKRKAIPEVPSDKKTASLIKNYCKKKMAMLDGTMKPGLEKKVFQASEALEKVIDHLQKLDLKKGEAALLVTTSCQLAMDMRAFAHKYGVSDAQLKKLIKESEKEIKGALKNPKKKKRPAIRHKKNARKALSPEEVGPASKEREAGEAILYGFGAPESAHGPLESIHEFKKETRRQRKLAQAKATKERMAAKRRR